MIQTSSDELYSTLLALIHSNQRHKFYHRTIEIQEWCDQMMTGDDQEELLIKYKRRETNEQKEQRIHLTNSRTPYVGNKVFNLFSEVHRSDRLQNNIVSENEESIDELKKTVEHFNGFDSLEKYLDNQFKQLNFYDPNAFIALEFTNDNPVNEKPKVYPVIIHSKNVFDFKYNKFKTLEYLITEFKQPCKIKEGEEHREGTILIFTMYSRFQSVVIKLIPENAIYDFNLEEDENGDFLQPQMFSFKDSEQNYFIDSEVFDHLLETIPAFRVGYLTDVKTDHQTFVSPLYPADKILLDLIWRKSEYDLSHALHGFYQKFIYVDDCPMCEGSGTVKFEYKNLMQQRDCGQCEGTGLNQHTSTQDIIQISRVNKDEHIPLSEYVHYELIPMELIKQQKEDIGELERDALNSIFGSNVLERSEVAITATEKNYDWRAVNNTLLPYAEKYSSVYRQCIMIIAEIQQIDILTVEYAFPNSFNLETINDLLDQRAKAQTAKVPDEIIQSIDLQIIRKQHDNSRIASQGFQLLEQVRPFKNKDAAEINNILLGLDQTDSLRILYIYFDELELWLNTNVEFWQTFTLKAFVQIVEVFVENKRKQINDQGLNLFTEPE